MAVKIDKRALGMAPVKLGSILLEYSAKLAAVPVAITAAASQKGNFASAVVDGFSNVGDVVSDVYSTATTLGPMVNDYHSLTAADFVGKYGSDFLTAAQNSASELGRLVVGLADNYTPILGADALHSTAAAATSLALLLGGARVFRFLRQRGQGSILDRAERRLGERVYGRRALAYRPVALGSEPDGTT